MMAAIGIGILAQQSAPNGNIRTPASKRVKSIRIPLGGDPGKEPWVARLLGRDAGGDYHREFLGPDPRITEPGVYETPGPRHRVYYGVFRTRRGDLCRIELVDSTLAELVDCWLDRIGDIVADPTAPPPRQIRDARGDIQYRMAGKIRHEFEGVVAHHVQDGGQSKIAHIDDEQDEGLFVRIQSWSQCCYHPDFDALVGRNIRVTIEVLD